MNNKLKIAIILIAAIAGLYIFYRFVFIRTVNYEIAGIKIPSKYNILTGSIKPIANYKGKARLRTIQDRKSNKIGLSEEQVVVAKLRWAIFEQWADSYPEYKGWRENSAVFKKANDDFKIQIKGRK
ncbi:MAG: hypothetical protein NTW09_01160 [Candidatus Omnitrophica bacterium]|nr:hypothetical protein [Candidatus Omnitrophota bacterium]